MWVADISFKKHMVKACLCLTIVFIFLHVALDKVKGDLHKRSCFSHSSCPFLCYNDVPLRIKQMQ